MRKRLVFRGMLVAVLTLSLACGAFAQGGSSPAPPPFPPLDEPPPNVPPPPGGEAPPPAGAPPLPAGELRELPRAELVGGGVRIGGVLVDPVKKEATVPCEINMREGLLEYALVGAAGKRHESLLVTRVEPYDLQVALLLLGLKAGPPLDSQGDPRKPEGSPVRLRVEWQEGTKVRNERLEALVRNERLDREMAETDWVFTGSRTAGGVFQAQLEGSLIAIFHDPAAIINNPLPGAEDDTTWHVNTARTPPVGTAVTLRIQVLN